MRIVKFVVTSTLKTMTRNMRVNIVVVVTLLVAYLAFFLGCCYIEDGVRDFDSFKMKDMDNSIHYVGHAPYSESKAEHKLTETALASFFEQYAFVKSYTVSEFNRYQNDLTDEGFAYYAIQKNFSDFYYIDVLEGRYFTEKEFEKGSAVCLVEKTYQELHSVQVGDVVDIDGASFEIIGVIKRNADAGGIFLPYRALEDDASKAQYLQWYTVTAKLSDVTLMSQINWSQLGLGGEAKTARAYFQENVSFFLSRSVLVLVGCAVLFAYALINLINVMYGKMDEEQKSLGIRAALGATHRQIFLQFFLECLTLVLAAVVLIFLMEPVIYQLVKGVFNHYFGVYTFVAMLIVSVVSSYFISLVLMRRFRKMNIVETIKNL